MTESASRTELARVSTGATEMNDGEGSVLQMKKRSTGLMLVMPAEPGETSEVRMWKMMTRTPPTRESPVAPPVAEERLTSTCRPCPTT